MTADMLRNFTDQLCVDPALNGMRLHRIYYYDAHPLEDKQTKPLKGGKIDFGRQPRALRQRQLYKEIMRAPHFAIRSGECTFAGWSVDKRKLDPKADSVQIVAADLHPNINQKGVDMRIGMDIAALTLKKIADVIVLVTGDSDFVPAMKFARREGAQLILVTLGAGIREPMYEHSDHVLDRVWS